MSCYTSVQEAYQQPQHMMVQYVQPTDQMVEHYCMRESYRRENYAALLARVTPCLVRNILSPTGWTGLRSTATKVLNTDGSQVVADFLKKNAGVAPTIDQMNAFIYTGKLAGAGTSIATAAAGILPYAQAVYNTVANSNFTDQKWDAESKMACPF